MLCAAVFVAALDQTMVLTVMPSIMRSLYIDLAHLNDAGWIITAYFLGYTVAMPLFGQLADVRGRRSMAIVALFLFMAGSALCAFLTQLGLSAARVVQAAGGGALVPIAMAAGADMFPPGRRALVLGIVGGAAEAGGVLGPIYGAGLSELWSWRLIFLVNIPLCLFLIPVCWRLLRPGLSYAAEALRGAAVATVAPNLGGRGAAGTVAAGLGKVGPAGGTAAGGDALIDDSSTGAQNSGDRGAPRRTRWWQRGRVDYGGACLMALALAGITIGLGTGAQTIEASAATAATPVKWPWLVVSAVAFVAFVLSSATISNR